MQGLDYIKMRSIAIIACKNLGIVSDTEVNRFYRRINNFLTNNADTITKEEWGEMKKLIKQIQKDTTFDIVSLDNRFKSKK